MTLQQLVNQLSFTLIQGNLNTSISEIVYDSRKATKDCVFVCLQGANLDSHDYIEDVVAAGASAIIIDRNCTLPADVTCIMVDNSRNALAYMSAAFYDHPASKLITIGLTGTKGKTTSSYMIQSILEKSGAKVGVIGTIGAIIDGKKIKTANTTPESFELQKLFHMMVEAGCKYCVMEVSSQGLKMNRVAGFTFDIGAFTNFSSDHIGPNEHASMDEYLYCKSLLFQQCKLGIVNMDDPNWKGALQNHTCEVKTFGFQTQASYVASNLKLLQLPGILGISYELTGQMNASVSLSVPGRFSVYNSLVAISVCHTLGISQSVILEALSTIQVPGRVEIIPVADHFTIMIDYAHNEASVESLLSTILEYKPKRIVCVYGGGGNRSKLRRYAMGELCGKMAQLSVLTCDNPRDEEITDINNDIKVGLSRSNGTYIEILDRKEAIFHTMDNALEGDIIILLGKGHEDYQEIKGEKIYFNEKEIIKNYKLTKDVLRF